MRTLKKLLCLTILLLIATNLYAVEKLFPAPPVKLGFYIPNKPQNVKEFIGWETSCDSPSTYSFMVSWKPVFMTWKKGVLPYIWHHYLADTTTNCVLSEVMCGDPGCIVKGSKCLATDHYGLVRILTYTDETHTGRSGFSQMAGFPRPDFSWDYDKRAWKCVGKKQEGLVTPPQNQ